MEWDRAGEVRDLLAEAKLRAVVATRPAGVEVSVGIYTLRRPVTNEEDAATVFLEIKTLHDRMLWGSGKRQARGG